MDVEVRSRSVAPRLNLGVVTVDTENSLEGYRIEGERGSIRGETSGPVERLTVN